MILARTNRLINESPEEKQSEYRKKLNIYIVEMIEKSSNSQNNKTEKNLFSGWVD